MHWKGYDDSIKTIKGHYGVNVLEQSQYKVGKK